MTANVEITGRDLRQRESSTAPITGAINSRLDRTMPRRDIRDDGGWRKSVFSGRGLQMARRVFFSFHYQRDVWRVNQIRNLHEIIGTAAAGFQDASLWEEAKRKGDATIKKMIDDALYNTSVTVICIGNKTAGRTYINYEIQKSLDRGNSVVGIQIHHLKDRAGNTDPPGDTPALLTRNGIPVYKYVDSASLARRIEEAAKGAGR
jgi:hypothetical protein